MLRGAKGQQPWQRGINTYTVSFFGLHGPPDARAFYVSFPTTECTAANASTTEITYQLETLRFGLCRFVDLAF